MRTSATALTNSNAPVELVDAGPAAGLEVLDVACSLGPAHLVSCPGGPAPSSLACLQALLATHETLPTLATAFHGCNAACRMLACYALECSPAWMRKRLHVLPRWGWGKGAPGHRVTHNQRHLQRALIQSDVNTMMWPCPPRLPSQLAALSCSAVGSPDEQACLSACLVHPATSFLMTPLYTKRLMPGQLSKEVTSGQGAWQV
jgi:hypothetical protein